MEGKLEQEPQEQEQEQEEGLLTTNKWTDGRQAQRPDGQHNRWALRPSIRQ